MKFDSNLAWSQASATVSANRDLVLALGGVFFLLPQLVLAEFMPDPPASAPGASPQETLAAMQGFYRQILPWCCRWRCGRCGARWASSRCSPMRPAPPWARR
jgi:hypothetical protein